LRIKQQPANEVAVDFDLFRLDGQRSPIGRDGRDGRDGRVRPALARPDEGHCRMALRANRIGVSDEAFAAMVEKDQIDILVDLTQHLEGNRLPVFAQQPAPVQVSFAGYPESTGLEAIGYRISDRWLEAGSGECGWKPEADLPSANSEQRSSGSTPQPAERVFLIDSFWCYDPCGMDVPAGALPARENGFVTFGCLNNFGKVNDVVLKLWARVLREVQGSRLVLLTKPGSHRERTLDFLAGEGLVAERIEFVAARPRQDYLKLYHRLDVMLDTFPYCGHTTSLDALWMGVPVVSMAGETAVSRGGLSILNNLGLPELVTFEENEFVRIATDLAHDLPRLADLRATLRARMESSVLMDAPRFARQIEDAYRAMFREWCGLCTSR